MAKMTLEEALKRIDELEKENAELKEKLASVKPGGRRPHDEKWMAKYSDFVVDYEAGKSIAEIVAIGDISRRTAYRYKEYYDTLNGKR